MYRIVLLLLLTGCATYDREMDSLPSPSPLKNVSPMICLKYKVTEEPRKKCIHVLGTLSCEEVKETYIECVDY